MNFDNRDRIPINTISNEDYVSDINYSLCYTRWFLRILGIWPLVISNPTTIEKNLAKIIRPLSSISMIILIIPNVAYIILQRSDRSDWIVLLAPIILQVGNVIKHFFMIVHADSLKRCVQHVETDWRRLDNPNDRAIMMRNINVGHRLTFVCTLCLYTSATLYNVVMPLCSGSTINELNNTVKPLAYPGADIFVDVQANVIYEIVFCTNFVSVFVIVTVSAATCNLTIILVRHTCGQIQIVMSRLERLVDPDVENVIVIVIEKRIAFIIENHVRSLEFSNKIENALRGMCLIEVITETLVICLEEYYCITEWSNNDRVAILTYIVLLVSFSFNLYLYCQVGEVLKEQCQQVGKAAYMIEWNRLPEKTNLAIISIIRMSHYPRNLTAGGLIELSRVSFASMIKTSFAYLNILRTTG